MVMNLKFILSSSLKAAMPDADDEKLGLYSDFDK